MCVACSCFRPWRLRTVQTGRMLCAVCCVCCCCVLYICVCSGTQLCGDPVRQVATVLLTNRVYPAKRGQFHGIHITRQAFNNAVMRTVDQCATACGADTCSCDLQAKHDTKTPHSGSVVTLVLIGVSVLLVVAGAAYCFRSKLVCCGRVADSPNSKRQGPAVEFVSLSEARDAKNQSPVQA